MEIRDAASLKDIVHAARLAVSFIEGMTRDEFLGDVMRQSAVIRQIEIMGEATKRLSKSFRAEYPEIRWKDVAGMRDVLIHAYDQVEPNEVWVAATISIPALLAAIEPILSSYESR